eukprot:1160425-Pelagomonas_calceolata.AAC.7
MTHTHKHCRAALKAEQHSRQSSAQGRAALKAEQHCNSATLKAEGSQFQAEHRCWHRAGLATTAVRTLFAQRPLHPA